MTIVSLDPVAIIQINAFENLLALWAALTQSSLLVKIDFNATNYQKSQRLDRLPATLRRKKIAVGFQNTLFIKSQYLPSDIGPHAGVSRLTIGFPLWVNLGIVR